VKTNDGVSRRELLAVLVALGASNEVLAQDAATADQRSFRVVLENERVRVLEYRSGPGVGVCGQGLHYHPDRVTVAVTPVKVRLTERQGRVVVRDLAAGQVFFAPAETHSTENVGGAQTRIYIIELKGGEWKPSTG